MFLEHNYKLSKFLDTKLTPVVGKTSTASVKNSTEFIDKVNHRNLFSGKMVSFYVDSLFTKAPLDDALEL